MLATIGIDPGKTGAASLLIDGKFKDYVDFSYGTELVEKLRSWKMFYDIDIAILEKVNAIGPKRAFGPGGTVVVRRESATASFSFGTNFGYWQGVLDTLGIPWREVHCSIWMKGLVPKKKNKNDKPGLLVARRMFPDAPLRYQKHDGRADAILMALYAYNNLRG